MEKRGSFCGSVNLCLHEKDIYCSNINAGGLPVVKNYGGLPAYVLFGFADSDYITGIRI